MEAVESMAMAPGALPRPGRVPEQRLLSPKTCFRLAAELRDFSWTEADIPVSFRSEATYRRRDDARGRTGWPHTGQARPSLARAWAMCGPLQALQQLPFCLPESSGILEFSMIFPEFLEHFHFWTFSAMHRHNKQKLALWHLLIG